LGKSNKIKSCGNLKIILVIKIINQHKKQTVIIVTKQQVGINFEVIISVLTGGAAEANQILVSKTHAELSMDAAACIGCGACVAACKNASAMLFVSAKVSHLGLLPLGRIEAKERVKKMVARMNREFICAKVL
jgi:ferredoxin